VAACAGAPVIALVVAAAVYVATRTLLLAVAAGVVAAAVHAWCYPYKRCWRCRARGGPRKTDASGRYWRDSCVVCGGSGKRVRFLARIVGGWGLD